MGNKRLFSDDGPAWYRGWNRFNWAAVKQRVVPFLTAFYFALPASAFSPDGVTAQVTDFGSRHFSLNLSGGGTSPGDVAEVLPLQLRTVTLSLVWARDGWSIGVAAGQTEFAIPGILDGSSAGLATVWLIREVGTVGGGNLSAELRASRSIAPNWMVQDDLGSTLRWTLRF